MNTPSHLLKKTKIIATLGPASSTQEVITSLAEAGTNIFRLNFSHGTHATHASNLKIIRSVEKKLKKPLGILADLQGPKLRIGTFDKGPISLKEGQSFSLDLDTNSGTNNRVSFPHPEIYKHLSIGSRLLLDDGKIELKIKKVSQDMLQTTVQVGGSLSNHKGVNIPGDLIPLSALTEKDHEDLKFILTQDIDFIALSFVQRGEDVADLKKLVGKKAAIISKIEKPQAIQNLASIVDLSDGIMIARGDLGVEFPPEKVPALQKKIVKACRTHGKPVIIATQMLESMIHTPIPTRAEASDVATAVYDGADAVMLSAESAAGSYPLESIQMMTKIIESVEKDAAYPRILEATRPVIESTISDAITLACQKLVYDLDARLIVTFTATGGTALRESHKRPPCPIIGLTHSNQVARHLTLAWGVVPLLLTKTVLDFEELTTEAMDLVRMHHFAPKDAPVIITFGVPFGRPGTTNIINIEKV